MYKDLLAGCMAGSSGVLIGHPLDTLKARVQLNCRQQGTWKILHGIRQHEGLLALYRGMAAPLAAAGLLNSLLFSGYTVTLRWLNPAAAQRRESHQNFSQREIIFASTVGTLFQVMPAIPIELVKTKLQTQNCTTGQRRGQFTGPLDCVAKIVRKHGFIGLYRGGLMMFWRDLIGYAFYIPAYEHFRRELRRAQKSSIQRDGDGSSIDPRRWNQELVCELLAGGMAGSLSWWIICPLELLKNRVQAAHHDERRRPASAQNWRQHCWEVFCQGRAASRGNLLAGIGAFYRGGFLLALRAFPVNACVFCVHSKCMEVF